jgi:putative hydrolase of the HAD superfamily
VTPPSTASYGGGMSEVRTRVTGVKRLLVFDGDDTLWDVEFLYDQARSAAASVVADAGLDAAAWVKLQMRIDVENVDRLGLSARRFPASSVEAYRALARGAGERADSAVERQISTAARSVFDCVAPLADEAAQVMAALSDDYALALLTQGDEQVQRRRIAASGLGGYFTLIRIPPRKTSASFQDVLLTCDVHALDACSIGNSLPSDINPALAIGMSAVWVASDVWEFELRETSALPGPLLAVERLSAVPRAVRQLLPVHAPLAEA